MDNQNENKNYIKSLLVLHNISVPQLAEKLEVELKRKCTKGSLYGKLRRNTLTLRECQAIAKILGYHIEFVKNKD